MSCDTLKQQTDYQDKNQPGTLLCILVCAVFLLLTMQKAKALEETQEIQTIQEQTIQEQTIQEQTIQEQATQERATQEIENIQARAEQQDEQEYGFATVSALPYESMYVSDQLSIAMRAGQSRNYKIVRYLTSGTRLSILDISEDGNWYKVRDTNKEGWVEVKDLMAEPGAQEKLVSAEGKLETIKIRLEEKQKEINSVNASLSALESNHETLKKDYKALTDDYQSLKKISGNAVRLDEDNQSLLEKVNGYQAELEELQTVNTIIRNDHFNEGLYYGGICVGSGIILALFCQRLARRQRRDAWS